MKSTAQLGMPRLSLDRAISLFALLLASAQLSGAQVSDSQLRSTLQERYNSMKSTMAARDSKAVLALLFPGFQSIDVDGHVQGADQMVQQIAGLPPDPNRVSDTTILSVERQGNTATVVQRYHMTTTRARPDGAPPQAIDLLATSTDTWVLSESVWFLERTQTDQFDYKIDGKVVAHKERAPHS